MTSILILSCMLSAVPAFAGDKMHVTGSVGISYPFRMQRHQADLLRPKTRYEILRAYGWLVDLKDGAAKQEAKLIAQREMVMKDDYVYKNYRYESPKIIWETQKEYGVRIPVRFSISHPESTYDYLVCVDKVSGKITCSGDNK